MKIEFTPEELKTTKRNVDQKLFAEFGLLVLFIGVTLYAFIL